jgi:hypothetical protein
MKTKTYLLVTAIIFLCVALLHISRVLFQWDAIFGSWEMSQSVSVLGVLVAGYLSYSGFTLRRHGH